MGNKSVYIFRVSACTREVKKRIGHSVGVTLEAPNIEKNPTKIRKKIHQKSKKITKNQKKSTKNQKKIYQKSEISHQKSKNPPKIS